MYVCIHTLIHLIQIYISQITCNFDIDDALHKKEQTYIYIYIYTRLQLGVSYMKYQLKIIWLNGN